MAKKSSKSGKNATKTAKRSVDSSKTPSKVTKRDNKRKATKTTKLAVSQTRSTPSKTKIRAALNLESHLTDVKWKGILNDLFTENYWNEIVSNLGREYDLGKSIFPPKDLIFNAFNQTNFDDLKIVILGQDPYHDNGQANGLAFSTSHGVTPLPPSLRNIFKELESDIVGFKAPDCGMLDKWCKQGILLLNATLTVEAHQPNSQSKYGWQNFTTDVLRKINDESSGVVFILWGGFAQKKASFIDPTKHTVIKAAHPSPLSFNKFQGCKCFSAANSALIKHGKKPVDWSL